MIRGARSRRPCCADRARGVASTIIGARRHPPAAIVLHPTAAPTAATDVLIALGANMGDRLANLRRAVEGLRLVLADLRVSHVYETEPAGFVHQAPFLNAAVRGATGLGMRRLFFVAKTLEFAAGRRPGPRLGPRPLDLDVIVFGGARAETPRLTVPHAAYARRAFVLAPLADVAPEVVPPGADVALQVMARQIDLTGVARAHPPSALLRAP